MVPLLRWRTLVAAADGAAEASPAAGGEATGAAAGADTFGSASAATGDEAVWVAPSPVPAYGTNAMFDSSWMRSSA